MDRKTKPIILPSGVLVDIKEYINARERNELRGIYLGFFSFKPGEEKPEFKEVSGEVAEVVEKKLIEIAVVSYDGTAENIIDRILDGTPEDYDFLLVELNKLNTGGFQTVK